MPNIIRTIDVGWGATGLVGTLGVTVEDRSGTPLINRTTDGFLESPAGSGEYLLSIPNWDVQWGARVVVDDGSSGIGHVISDWLDPLPVLSGSGAYPLTVHVTDGTNPIPGALVRATGAQAAGPVATDGSGNALVSLNAGAVLVSVTAQGYEGFAPTSYTISNSGQWPNSSTTLPITLTPSPTVTPGAVGTTAVYVTVVDTSGNPKGGLSATFTMTSPPPGNGSLFDTTPQRASSDHTGLMQIPLVIGATYQFKCRQTTASFVVGSGPTQTLPNQTV